jgi:hypothetical protein
MRYLAWSAILFALKYAVDLAIARGIFHQPWPLLNYLAPTRLVGLFGWPLEGQDFLMAMLLAALPFIIAGLIVTLRRLRDAGLPRVLVILFFAPFINLLFFLALCFIPSRSTSTADPLQPPQPHSANAPGPPPPLVQALIQGDAASARKHRPLPPDSASGPILGYARPAERPLFRSLATFFPAQPLPAALLAVLLPIPFVYGLCFFSIYLLHDYGWGLFIGLPFILGMASALLYGIRTPRTAGQCTTIGLCAVLAAAAVLLLFAFEGIICIIMAAPLWVPLACLGAGVGYLIQKRPLSLTAAGPMLASLVLLLPMLMALDKSTRQPPPLRAVTSSVIINAPPAVIWRNVIEFPPLPEPTEWLFHTGVAYPTSATIIGTGPGAVRHCVFTTGSFIEPIEIWEQNRRLRFSVRYNPPVMNEWSFGRKIHPPHLTGFFESRRGEFLLEDLGHGQTRLQGTTWYEHNLWPTAYWYRWTDWIVHRIHLRVLDHVKRLSEQTP